MKTRVFLAAALVALGFAACNNNDVPYFEEEGAKATISVRVFADKPLVRQVGDLTGGVEGTECERRIHSLQIFLFNPAEQFIHSAFFNENELVETNDGFLAEGIETTVGERTMVVIANHPRITGYPTKGELLSRDFGTLVQDIEDVGLVMTAVVESQHSFTLVPGENLFGRPVTTLHDHLPANARHSPGANLQLVRINARVALTGVSFTNNTPDNRFSRFELVEVAMFNVRNQTQLFHRPTTWITDDNNLFSFGEKAEIRRFPSSQSSYRIGTPTGSLIVNMEEEGIENLSDISVENAIFFYVFENDGDRVETASAVSRPGSSGTFIVLRGKLLDDNNVQFKLPGIYTCPRGYTYYAIWINDASFGVSPNDEHNRGNNTILRNRQYNIRVNLWGPGHPEIDPKSEALLDVHVTVANWVEVEQNVNWGTPPTP